MNRIYLPYPIEVILKIFSWIFAIIIDLIELILKPFRMIGLRCSAVFVILAASFCGYVHFRYALTIGQSFSMLGALIGVFVAFLGAVHLINFVLIKVIRPPLANIIFAPVAVSFTIPIIRKNSKKH